MAGPWEAFQPATSGAAPWTKFKGVEPASTPPTAGPWTKHAPLASVETPLHGMRPEAPRAAADKSAADERLWAGVKPAALKPADPLEMAASDPNLPVGARVLAAVPDVLVKQGMGILDQFNQTAQNQRAGQPVSAQDVSPAVAMLPGALETGRGGARPPVERAPPTAPVEPPPGIARNPEGRPILTPGQDPFAGVVSPGTNKPVKPPPGLFVDPRAAQAGQQAVAKVADRTAGTSANPKPWEAWRQAFATPEAKKAIGVQTETLKNQLAENYHGVPAKPDVNQKAAMQGAASSFASKPAAPAKPKIEDALSGQSKLLWNSVDWKGQDALIRSWKLTKAEGKHNLPLGAWLDQKLTPSKPAAKTHPAKAKNAVEAWYDNVQKEGKHGEGLDLSPAVRVARAKKQGFNTDLTLYHGTGKSDFLRFDTAKNTSEPAVFLTDDPKVANAYTHKGGSPNIIAIWSKAKNPKVTDWNGETYSGSRMSKELKEAKAAGHDALFIKNMRDIGGGGKPQNQYAFFEPGNLRSKYGAAFNPKVKAKDAHMLSASASSGEELKGLVKPLKEFVGAQDDRFFKLRQAHTADKAEFAGKIAAMPEAVKNPETQKRFYRKMENDPDVKLTPEEQTLYDQHVAPLKREERDLYEEVKKTDLDVKDYDPEYAHRIVKGKNRQFDQLLGNAGDDANPISGFKSRKTSSMEPRRFFTIERADGQRKVVSIGDQGKLSVVEGGKYTPITHDALRRGEEAPRGVGDKFRAGGHEWTIRQARTNELEEHTGIQYYQNALANTIDNVLRLRAVARMIYETNQLKNSPEFLQHSRLLSQGDIPRGWKTPEMPLFRDRAMDPKLAGVIDDFYGKSKGDLLETISKINRFAVGSLFWSPVPHALNAGAHWVTARGWDWITPHGIKSLALDSARAMREVITQGPAYQRLLREGSGLVYGGIANREFYQTMMKRLGESIVREPAKWDPIARVLGVGPSDLAKMIYGGSSRALWSASDMFMLQRVFELERKGMSAAEAIKEAEKHIPNYRIPPQVLGSRTVASVLKEPALTEFSRYHYGMMKSYAHMAKDLAVGTPKQKFDALGNIMATAALMVYVWPAINYGIQKLTGDKDLELGPKGSTTIFQDLLDLYNGNKNFVQVLSSLVTMAPVLRAGMEAFPSNMDWFTHKNIAEPDDMKHGRVGRVAAQEAEHLATNLVQPYGMLDHTVSGKDSLARSVAKQALGLRNKPKPWSGQRGRTNDAKEAAKRHARPRGLIEKGEGELENEIRRYKGTQ